MLNEKTTTTNLQNEVNSTKNKPLEVAPNLEVEIAPDSEVNLTATKILEEYHEAFMELAK